MNFKTTLLLLVVFVVLGAMYFVQRSTKVSGAAVTAESPTQSPAVSREFLENKLGEPVKVVVRTNNADEEWVFEKDEELPRLSDQPGWRMTAPHDFVAKSWEVNRFVSQFNGLRYDIRYEPGQAGAVSAAEAGLQPPKATIQITDESGNTATIEMGKPVSPSETYVRVAGTDAVIVGKANLDGLVKDSALEYRDQQIWKFDKEDVRSVEIFDYSDMQSPVTYRLTRSGNDWVFESPFTAKATKKVDEMVRSLATLRAVSWLDDREELLGTYGVEPGAYTFQVTVEEEVEADAETVADQTEEDGATDDDADTQGSAEDAADANEGDEPDDTNKQAQPQTIEKTYVLHLSKRSPLGEDTKVYFRIGDESIVGALNKTIADRITPDVNEWRQMKVTTVDVKKATRIELTVAGASAVFVKDGAAWKFEEDDSAAEKSDITALLSTIADLTAVAFVDLSGAQDESALGLDDPQAVVRLAVPGEPEVERIGLGAYTDQTTKRLLYVRRNQLQSIAKVRVADVQPLLKDPRDYRDRTVFNLQAPRIEGIALSLDNDFGNDSMDLVLSAEDDGWKLTAPVRTDVQQDRVKMLVDTLASLSAEQVVADADARSAYGLHDPQARVTITYQPPPTYRIEEQEPDDEGNVRSEPVEVPSEKQEFGLLVTEHEGAVYATREGGGVVYRVDRALYDQLTAELRTDEVLTFDDAEVTHFSIRSGETTHAFRRDDGKWVYAAEPDLPLDDKKVTNLLLQLKDLKTHRYAAHAATDLAAYGLEDPAQVVHVALADGTTAELRVSDQSCAADPKSGLYATIAGSDGIFLLTPDMQKRYAVDIAALEPE